jgi:hypothetical protein
MRGTATAAPQWRSGEVCCDLKLRGVQVRVGMEATGHARWFELLLEELGTSCGWGTRRRFGPGECGSRRTTARMLNSCSSCWWKIACASPKPDQAETIDFSGVDPHALEAMLPLLGSLLRLLVSPANVRDIALENLAFVNSSPCSSASAPGLGSREGSLLLGVAVPGVGRIGTERWSS